MMSADAWAGRTAIVTGASRGIGEQVARQLAADGAQVVLMARDKARLEVLADDLETNLLEGATPPVVVAVDVTDAAALAAAAAQALDALGGRLHLLANVAGSSLRHARLEDTEDEDWQAALDLNLLACVRLQKHCFEALREAGGTIVNVGSLVAGRAAVLGSPYAAAKAALASLTRSTALEWARYGIRANTVEPGYVATDFNARLVEAGLEDRLLGKVPTGRAITAQEVARLILAAGSPDMPSLTGETIRLDGGWSARL